MSEIKIAFILVTRDARRLGDVCWLLHRQRLVQSWWDKQYLLTYLLTPCSTVLLEKLTGSAASQEIPRILWNPKVHNRIHKCPPPVPILSQSIPPHPISWRSILIYSSHLRLGLPSGLLPSGFPTKTLYIYTSPISHTCYMPRPMRLATLN